jgi:hypothetical protein
MCISVSSFPPPHNVLLPSVRLSTARWSHNSNRLCYHIFINVDFVETNAAATGAWRRMRENLQALDKDL